MNKSRTTHTVSIGYYWGFHFWPALPILRLMLDVGSRAGSKELAQRPGSLMRTLQTGISTAGKTPHAEAAITLWGCQTSRKMIRAFPHFGGEPEGCSQGTGLLARSVAVVRCSMQAPRRAGQGRCFIWAGLALPSVLWGEMWKPYGFAFGGEKALYRAQSPGLAHPITCQQWTQEGPNFTAGYLVIRCWNSQFAFLGGSILPLASAARHGWSGKSWPMYWFVQGGGEKCM